MSPGAISTAPRRSQTLKGNAMLMTESGARSLASRSGYKLQKDRTGDAGLDPHDYRYSLLDKRNGAVVRDKHELDGIVDWPRWVQ
jgi:hypothetical protein